MHVVGRVHPKFFLRGVCIMMPMGGSTFMGMGTRFIVFVGLASAGENKQRQGDGNGYVFHVFYRA